MKLEESCQTLGAIQVEQDGRVDKEDGSGCSDCGATSKSGIVLNHKLYCIKSRAGAAATVVMCTSACNAVQASAHMLQPVHCRN